MDYLESPILPLALAMDWVKAPKLGFFLQQFLFFKQTPKNKNITNFIIHDHCTLGV